MVWAAITSDGKMPLIFVPQGIKAKACARPRRKDSTLARLWSLCDVLL
ncbi:unnamed protein product [Cylicostephanus goldi]|uniref:Uncharacterized protein n=1 Tax=Cylicostephanus goldi TaxID=71465 RepID=A0A3P7PZ64_CYLGO|nr:unnamed protein product [Cylicostephanus goldi]